MDSVIKIFGAKSWHDTVSIVGNKEALIRFRDLIQDAITKGFSDGEFLESDGEGYNIEIKLHDWGFYSDGWNNLPVHYSDDLSSEKNWKYWENLHDLMTSGRRDSKIEKLEGE